MSAKPLPGVVATEQAQGYRCAVCCRKPGVLDSLGFGYAQPGWVCSLRCREAQIRATKLHDEGAGL